MLSPDGHELKNVVSEDALVRVRLEQCFPKPGEIFQFGLQVKYFKDFYRKYQNCFNSRKY